MVQFASYLRRVLSKTRLIFPRINGPNVLSSRIETQKNLRGEWQPPPPPLSVQGSLKS